jgi:hypothetical protein
MDNKSFSFVFDLLEADLLRIHPSYLKNMTKAIHFESFKRVITRARSRHDAQTKSGIEDSRIPDFIITPSHIHTNHDR